MKIPIFEPSLLSLMQAVRKTRGSVIDSRELKISKKENASWVWRRRRLETDASNDDDVITPKKRYQNFNRQSYVLKTSLKSGQLFRHWTSQSVTLIHIRLIERHRSVIVRHRSVTVHHISVTIRHRSITVHHISVTVRHGSVTKRVQHFWCERKCLDIFNADRFRMWTSDPLTLFAFESIERDKRRKAHNVTGGGTPT